MPFLAFDLDAIANVPDVARAIGVPDGTVAWGLLRTWRWCWQEKRDTVEPAHIRGFFGCDASSALVAFGFLDSAGEAFRVKGAERYLRVRAARSAGGKAAAANLKRGLQQGSSPGCVPAAAGEEPEKVPGSAPALTSNIEHLSSNYVRRSITQEPEPEGEQPRPVTVVTPPDSPPEGWDGSDFWRWAQDRRRATGYTPERHQHPRKLSAWWSEARGVVADVSRLKEAFYRFGDDPYWRKTDPPYPFSGFMTQWERFVPPLEEEAHAS